MLEMLRQRVLAKKEMLLRKAIYCNENQALAPSNPVEIMAQRNMWLGESTISYEVWRISTTIIATQELARKEEITTTEFLRFMDDLGFEVDENGRRPKPEMNQRLKSLFITPLT